MKKSLREKITLLFLFVLASPFIFGIFAIFILANVIIFPFEGLIYYRSVYYKDFKERYYLLITLQKHYKLYNAIRKVNKTEIMILFNKQIICYADNKTILIPLEEEIKLIDGNWCVLDEDLLELVSEKNHPKQMVFLVKRTQFSKDDYKIARKNSLFLIYEK